MRRPALAPAASGVLAASLRYRLAVAVCLSALTLLVMAGCSSAASTSGSATASPSSPTGQTYASKAFVVPLAVTLGASLKSPPNPDSRNLLSWDAADGPNNKVRFLVPVNLYRPGSVFPEAPPKDYLTYLQELASQGIIKLSDVTKITVDGHPATLMTETLATDHGFDGALGCPKADADQAEGCYGPQPEWISRIAVIPVGNSTLLAWARTSKASPNEAFLTTFETMLNSVRFR
ncbi:MAG TPA: hypothetical protein VN714_24430 [Trebonia sp.]|jgi:hypothetical protein|nr:hypothetical protein [Trebonia sp.]